ncbi:hypothetical protein BY996DRAFT_4579858 [Phakopsora pachyrhizi]|uniref:Expressed protein n=1 Tax=Phakopsora pachyrhizi TaxID=170000 RepID=A0AAV0B2P2_PHAPC|nr:hypothetical protein BY996DRAFT_4579858 [Phakopsora pachyrhizi]CAH7678659.1 expressed protein [Phakopsora pachyrhizi]
MIDGLRKFLNGSVVERLEPRSLLVIALSILIVLLQNRFRLVIQGTIRYVIDNTKGPPPPSSSSSRGGTGERVCSNCFKVKRTDELKRCSRCQSSFFCDLNCQKANWKSHRSICKDWNNILDKQNLFQQVLPNGLTRATVEKMLNRWCEFHKHLLIFATIHGLDLPRSPGNSLTTILLISLRTENDDDGYVENLPMNRLFEISNIGPFDLERFLNLNPGMSNVFERLTKFQEEVRLKGGLGVAMVLVTCGSVVQAIPVGLPSMSDLDTIKREKNWRDQFDQALESGIRWSPK